MKIFKALLTVFLCGSIFAYAEDTTFKQVRYNGGSFASNVDAKDWGNTLTVTADAITLELSDNQKVVIPARSVTSLSYGQEAHRRVGTMLAVLVAPVAIVALFNKTRLHFIGIEFNTPEGENNGILLQGDKDDYRAMLVALQAVTGVPVSVAEKERGFVPVGLKTSIIKAPDERKNATGVARVDLRFRWVSGTVSTTGEIESRPLTDPAAMSLRHKTAEMYWKEVAGGSYANGVLDDERPDYVAIWEINEMQKLGSSPPRTAVEVTGVLYARHASGCLLVPGVFGTYEEGTDREATLRKAFKQMLEFLGTVGKRMPGKPAGCHSPEALGGEGAARNTLTNVAHKPNN